jgi:HSP20 family protein
MANQETKPNEQQTQQSRGEEVTRSSPERPRGLTRRGGYNPFDLMPTPIDLFRMTPFSLMRRITEEMDRVYHEFTTSPGHGATWAPAVEISELDGKYVVRAELPGVKPADVKLEITDEALVLEGERKSENQEAKSGVHLTERQYGRFYRSIPLPEGANIEEARARFENGVLEITVPMKEQRTKRREIPIEVSSTGSAASSGKAA